MIGADYDNFKPGFRAILGLGRDFYSSAQFVGGKGKQALQSWPGSGFQA